MSLSIRDRLTLWYGLVLLVVLLTTGGTVLLLHARLGLDRIDQELANRATTLAADLNEELDEGEALQVSAQEVVHELESPGTGVAVIDGGGEMLAQRGLGTSDPRPADLIALDAEPVTIEPAGRGLRVRPIPQSHQAHEYRIVVWTSLAPFEAERATLVRTLWLGVPVVLLIAVAGGWGISRRALQPLADMARQTESISHRRPEARLQAAHAGDELGTLARAFNALLDRLAGTLRLQRGFMAGASHELRTPVSVARTTAQVTLARESRTEEEYRESLTIIADHTDRMSKMVDDMLTLSLADADGRPLQLSELYLDELIQESGRAIQVLGLRHQVDVHVTTPRDIACRADERLLQQLFLNVLQNAVRHASSPGRVDVEVTVAGSEASVVITDTGPGIAPADRERIFERFVRIDAAGSPGGGGLGLPIARWIADAHGGSVRADSAQGSEGGGRFVVVLPLGH